MSLATLALTSDLMSTPHVAISVNTWSLVSDLMAVTYHTTTVTHHTTTVTHHTTTVTHHTAAVTHRHFQCHRPQLSVTEL